MNQKTKTDRAIGFKRAPGGWVVVNYELRDGKVVKESQSQPDLRAIALEKFKRAVADFWDDAE